MELNESEYEAALFDAHRKAKKLARSDANREDVLIAKVATLVIRQLHASDVVCILSLGSRRYANSFQYPRTAIRAMVYMEFDEEARSTGGAIGRAKRDIRTEGRARRAEMEAGEGSSKDANHAKTEIKDEA